MNGQSVPKYQEIIIHMKNFNKIIKFDEVTNILTCESGCILQDVQNFLETFGLPFIF